MMAQMAKGSDPWPYKGGRCKVEVNGKIVVDFDAGKCCDCGEWMETYDDVYVTRERPYAMCKECAQKYSWSTPFLEREEEEEEL